jgi:GNAT superfamily N-acetyltransferase
MTGAGFTISEVDIPESIDGADAGDFIDAIEVRNIVSRHVHGNDDMVFPAAEILPMWHNQQFRPMRMFIARVDGRAVARGVYEMSAGISAPEVQLVIEVHPDFRRRGIGSALFDTFVRLGRSEGRRELQAWFMIPAIDSTDWIVATTGFGRVPAVYPGVAFALRHGLTLEQVARTSALPLPVDHARLTGLIDTARSFAGADYAVESWVTPTPETRIDDLAELVSRMSTDAPAGGLEVTAQHWDAARVRANEASEAASGQVILITAAEHLPTGRLVAFTALQASGAPDDVVGQADTLVRREHRGHRLGMLVKAENLAFLERTLPGHPRVITHNAEENRPMLDVNEKIGFVTAGFAPVWSLAL